MASLKEYRVRIASVTATRKITRAMQMVASAKLKRAQDSVSAARPYADHIDASMTRLLAAVGDQPELPLMKGSSRDSRHLLVVITAERGLCGAFNNNVVKRARAEIRSRLSEDKQVSIMTVGRKGRVSLERDHGDRLTDHYGAPQQTRAVRELAWKVSNRVMDVFVSGDVDRVSLVSSSFQSILVQTPVVREVLPVRTGDPPAGEETAASGSHLCEPSEEAILAKLVPRHVASEIYVSLLENSAGEHGARMTAMDNATRSASDMLRSLELEYNRARQARITTELIEIISGAEAV